MKLSYYTTGDYPIYVNPTDNIMSKLMNNTILVATKDSPESYSVEIRLKKFRRTKNYCLTLRQVSHFSFNVKARIIAASLRDIEEFLIRNAPQFNIDLDNEELSSVVLDLAKHIF